MLTVLFSASARAGRPRAYSDQVELPGQSALQFWIRLYRELNGLGCPMEMTSGYERNAESSAGTEGHAPRNFYHTEGLLRCHLLRHSSINRFRSVRDSVSGAQPSGPKKAKSTKVGDAKLRGYSAHPHGVAMPVEPPKRSGG